MNFINTNLGSYNVQVQNRGIYSRSSFGLPNHVLAGYWFEWDRSDLSVFGHTRPEEVPLEYNMIIVAFMTSPISGQVPTFSPDPNFLGEQGFIDGVNLWKSQGREVLISLGGAAGVTEVMASQKEAFKDELRRVVNTYGFTGVDINLENRSITAADNQTVIPQVLNELKAEFNAQGRKFFITMAPEFPYLRPGATYLPYVRDTHYDLIMPQYYNQGGDGPAINQPPWNIPNNNLAMREDFIFYLTQQLGTGVGMVQVPPEKLLIGLPSTEHAAYGFPPGIFYTDPSVIAAAITRLRNAGINVRGVMTWSIPQDKEAVNGRPSFDFGHRVGAFLGLPNTGGVTPPPIHPPITPPPVQPPVTPPPVQPPVTPPPIQPPVTPPPIQPPVTPPPVTGLLSPPTNLRVVGQTQTSITLAWDATHNSMPISGYEIFRDHVRIADVTGDTLTYTDHGLAPGRTYVYTIRSHVASGHSNTATGTTSQHTITPPPIQPPITPPPVQPPITPPATGGITFRVTGEGSTRQNIIVTNQTATNIPAGWQLQFNFTGGNPALEWPAAWAMGSSGGVVTTVNDPLSINGSVTIPMGVHADTRITNLSVNGMPATRG